MTQIEVFVSIHHICLITKLEIQV